MKIDPFHDQPEWIRFLYRSWLHIDKSVKSYEQRLSAIYIFASFRFMLDRSSSFNRFLFASAFSPNLQFTSARLCALADQIFSHFPTVLTFDSLQCLYCYSPRQVYSVLLLPFLPSFSLLSGIPPISILFLLPYLSCFAISKWESSSSSIRSWFSSSICLIFLKFLIIFKVNVNGLGNNKILMSFGRNLGRMEHIRMGRMAKMMVYNDRTTNGLQ